MRVTSASAPVARGITDVAVAKSDTASAPLARGTTGSGTASVGSAPLARGVPDVVGARSASQATSASEVVTFQEQALPKATPPTPSIGRW